MREGIKRLKVQKFKKKKGIVFSKLFCPPIKQHYFFHSSVKIQHRSFSTLRFSYTH